MKESPPPSAPPPSAEPTHRAIPIPVFNAVLRFLTTTPQVYEHVAPLIAGLQGSGVIHVPEGTASTGSPDK